jgi:GT2 family glycosyltransferase
LPQKIILIAPLDLVSTPLCTVIVVNWNGKHFLDDCLRSLQQQTMKDFDILLVDNGSRDGSVDFVAGRFPEVRLLPLTENVGYCKANNLGIQNAFARGAEFVLLLNNDTTVASNFIEHMLRAVMASADIAAVCPKIFFADQPDLLWYAGADFSLWTSRSRHAGWREQDTGQFDQPRSITQATGCAMLVRASAIRKVGMLNEKFWAYVEDVDWSIRFRNAGYRILYEPQARVWHRDGGTSTANGSQYLRQYLTTRNLLLLCREHVPWWQLPIFLLGFLIFHAGFYGCLRIAHRDFRALRAIFLAIFDAIQSPASGFDAILSTRP